MKNKNRWAKLLFPLIGFLSLIWLLVLLIPKPGRAKYPCMRATAPLAFSFNELTSSACEIDTQPPIPDIDPLPDEIIECEFTIIPPTATDNCAGEITAITNDLISYNTPGIYTVTWIYDDAHVPMGAIPEPAEKIKVLIVTGNDWSGHYWRETTLYEQATLETVGLFEVKVSEDVEIFQSSTLSYYDVIILNGYWPFEISSLSRSGLLAFVEGGKGLVAIHYACGSFPEWEEYRELIGSVWEDGIAGHEARGEFIVEIEDPNHPITKGVENFRIDDELYAKLSGAAQIEVLAGAYSNWSQQVEPLVFVKNYGQGRVVQNLLGHDVRARGNKSYRRLSGRCVEWAATGTVTYSYYDTQGNTSIQTQKVVVTDTQQPVPDVDPLPDITAECDSMLSPPTATDNCAGEITAVTNDPMTYSTLGIYTVTWTYDDGNGNSNSQIQKVEIIAIPPPRTANDGYYGYGGYPGLYTQGYQYWNVTNYQHQLWNNQLSSNWRQPMHQQWSTLSPSWQQQQQQTLYQPYDFQSYKPSLSQLYPLPQPQYQHWDFSDYQQQHWNVQKSWEQPIFQLEQYLPNLSWPRDK